MQIMKNLARSFENGIVFYSRIFDDKALKVFYDENNTIRTEVISDEFEEKSNEDGKLSKTVNKRYIKEAGALSAVLVCLAIALTGNFHWILAAFLFSLYASYDVILFAHTVNSVRKKDEKGRSVAKFHAAEHKVINAYLKLGRVPTFEEIKSESCLSDSCGSLLIIRKIVYFTVLSLITPVCGINTILYILLMIGLIVCIRTLGQRPGFLKFLEFFFLSKPSDEELNLALVGIKEYDRLENEAKENSEVLEIEIPGMRIKVVYPSIKNYE